MRKLSVFYEHILQACEQSGKTIPEVLAFCREQGISAVEMNYSLFASEREVIAPMLSDAGLVISCMHETFDFPSVNRGMAYSSHSSADRRWNGNQTTIHS